ncbi:uncharacterized protein LOC118206757 [Anguilla anguilla]|uniref:uncharacterized protein LOC118206757 n=1 Tax=Anguilla anguilla TaxID=7936 RepID=UPI0015B1419A|nr:uncharacterized protein LOC118206757 [Anguilla anguilla]
MSSNAGDLCNATAQRKPEALRELKQRRRRSREGAKENLYGTPQRTLSLTPRMRPVTPLISRTQANLMTSSSESSQRLSEKAVSPNLANLRMTPGPSLQERQRQLQEKHQRAKESLDSLAVGGGVSMWPEMDRMRLTGQEGVTLGLGCVTVSFGVFLIFKYLHGSLLLSVHRYTVAVNGFTAAHPVHHGPQSALNHTLLVWHTHFLHLQDSIKKQFETQLLQTHGTYQLYLLLYIGAIGTLLYYLADNVIQKSRLTPRRIKMWVLLLVATATWTLLMLRLLVWYQRLENAVEEAVRGFQDELAHLATLDLDLRMYHNIATYWQARCLPPLSRGTLTIFGVLPVRDLFFYLQYYSVPVLTALCTPVLQLLLALKEIYVDPPTRERPLLQN